MHSVPSCGPALPKMGGGGIWHLWGKDSRYKSSWVPGDPMALVLLQILLQLLWDYRTSTLFQNRLLSLNDYSWLQSSRVMMTKAKGIGRLNMPWNSSNWKIWKSCPSVAGRAAMTQWRRPTRRSAREPGTPLYGHDWFQIAGCSVRTLLLDYAGQNCQQAGNSW